MVQQLLSLLPQDQVAAIVFSLVVFGVVMGASTLLLGGLRARGSMTILLMCVGIAVGRALPGWLGWTTEPNATAILGALIGAVLGFVLHRLWTALGLGLLAAVLAAVVLWFQVDGPRQFSPPEMPPESGAMLYLKRVWVSLPAEFHNNLLLVMAPIHIVTAVTGFIFSRIGAALFYALGGAIILAVALLFGEASGHMPGIQALLPALIEIRVLLFAAIVLLGTLVQLAMMEKHHRPKKPRPLPEDDS
jgi:hypothetical protein